MFKWILQIICQRNETENAERHVLLHPPNNHSPKFPPPHTILTAPKARPSPLVDLPHHRHARAQSHQYGSMRTNNTEGRPNTAGLDRGRDAVDSPERLGGISKFYSQRMRPLTRSSLPPSPAFKIHPSTVPQTSIPTIPTSQAQVIAEGTRTVPTSPTQPLHPNPSHPPHPHSIAQMSRSVSAPTGDMLTLHLLSRIQSPRLTPLTRNRPAEIEGFGTHQLPLGTATNPRSVMILRGRSRPRSATTLLPLSRSSSTGPGPARSASDEGINRVGAEGLDWTGRRGRSPGPSRMALSRRSTVISTPGPSGRGGMGSRPRSTLSLESRENSNEGLRVPAVPSPNAGEVSPAMSIDVEEEEKVVVLKKDLGLAEVFGRPLGHRQSRRMSGVTRGSTSRSGRGKRIMTG